MNAAATLANLASALGGFEARPGQRRMAEAVEQAVLSGRDLVVEAGTGTGKTLAYLTPLLALNKRVLVSTATKQLQSQILGNDLPVAQAAAGRHCAVAVLKGRANYICLQRLQGVVQGRAHAGRGLTGELLAIEATSRGSPTGERADVPGVSEEHPVWSEVTASADNCLGSACPRFEECFVVRARRRAANAQLLIVNHHLLLADYAVRERWDGASLLPSVDAIVIDEAHALAETATAFFGAAITEKRLQSLTRDLGGAVAAASDQRMRQALLQAIDALDMSGTRLVARIRDEKHQAAVQGPVLRRLQPAAEQLDQALAELAALLGDGEFAKDAALQKTAELLRTVRGDLAQCIPAEDPTAADQPAATVRWVELRPRDCAVVARPVDVGPILQRTLLAEKAVRIFTSATLANAGSFALTLRHLGLPADCDTLSVDSPFDFGRQALLYLPRNMPEPSAAGRDAAVAKTIADLALAAGGATMALFSSHAALRSAAALVPNLLPMAVLVQGQESKEALLQRFEQLQPAVLLATLGFWQGVDLPAHALRVVVLEKVPFPPPDEPLFAARAALLESQGRSSFGELSLPSASLILRQGFGRLVRSARHVGVVALLDPRVLTKRYGAQLLGALPPARQALRFDEVTAFLRENIE